MKKVLLSLMSIMLVTGCAKHDHLNEEPLVDITLTGEQTEQFQTLIDILPKEESLSFSVLNNQEKITLAFALLKEENTNDKTHITKEYEITKTSITNVLNKYFGDDITVTMEDYMCPYCDNEILYKYDTKTEKFIDQNRGHGYYALINHNQIIGTKKQGDKYLIEVVRLFASPQGDFWMDHPTEIYESENDAYESKNMVIDLKNTDYCYNDEDFGGLNCDLEKVAKEQSDKFTKYIYKFDINDLFFISYQKNSNL